MSVIGSEGARPTISLLLSNLHGGGAERVSVNLANGFIGRGYKVDLVLVSAVGDLLDDLRPEVRVIDLKVKRFRWLLPALSSYMRRDRPEVLLACMWPLTVISVWARALSRVPVRVFVAEHATWSRSELLERWWAKWIIRNTMHRAFPSAAGVVTVSNGAADDLAQFAHLGRSSINVIYNPVVGQSRQSEIMLPIAAGWWEGTHQRVLAVGTLKKIKDFATLLDAFALMSRQANVRLLILGEGACRNVLEEKIKELGLEEKVFMPGFVKETSPYYERADLHVLSSISEGLPTVIIEALAAGTPVVSTDCPSGPREILSDGQYGSLVPVGDAKALAMAMEGMLQNPQDSAILRARAQDFSIDKSVDQYLKLMFPSEAREADE